MFGGPNPQIEHIKNNKYIHNFKIDARIQFTLFVYDLQNAGCPLHVDYLTIEQWQWLAELKRVIEELRLEEIRNA